MKLQERIAPSGRFKLIARRPDGAVVWRLDEANVVTVLGKAALARLLGAAAADDRVTQIAFGTSGSAASPDDTAIANAFIKPVDEAVPSEGGHITFHWTLGLAEANGMAIREFGLLTAGGELFARKSRDTAVIDKEIDISLEGEWTLIF
jgi:hypothetical protein